MRGDRPGQMRTLPTTERFADLLMPAIRAIHPPEAMKRMRRVDAAITDEGKASEHALSGSLGYLVAAWFVSGGLSTGSNISTEYRVGADGVLERFDVSVKTAPTGADLKVRIRQAGHILGTATIPAGTKTGALILGQAVNAGDVLTIDISQVGSTVAGSNLSVNATIREERGS